MSEKGPDIECDCGYKGPSRGSYHAGSIIEYHCPTCGKWHGDKDVS